MVNELNLHESVKDLPDTQQLDKSCNLPHWHTAPSGPLE